MSIRNVWRGAGRPPDGKMVLDNQLLSVARQFVDVRNCSIEEKQSYFETVCGWFDLECEENAFPLPAPQLFNPSISQRFDRTPVVISYLEEYDRKCGFNYADRTRHALFQFANLVIKSDGTVTCAEANALLQFKTTLYPHGGDSSLEDDLSKSDQTRTGTAPVENHPSRPLEDLLKELDALVGLDRVKADVRQLINFLKVQKMREDC